MGEQGAVKLGSTLSVAGAATFDDNVVIGGTVSIYDNVRVSHGVVNVEQGAVKLGSTLSVADAATFDDNVDIGGTLSANGATTLDSSLKVGSTLSANGAATFDNNAAIGGTLSVTGAAEFDSTVGADGDLRVGAAGAYLFNVTASDGGAYSDKDIDVCTSDDTQLVNYGSLKAQGEARYEYMIQVLCNTLGLDFVAIQNGYNAALLADKIDIDGTTDDHFEAINPLNAEIGERSELDAADLANVDTIETSNRNA